jgi:LemA protein
MLAMLGYIVLGILAAVVVVVAWLVLTYNGLILVRNRYLNAFSQIDVQLKRRYDLIPNLVEAVKGFMSHEKETLEAVTKARAVASEASDVAARDTTAAAVGALVGAEVGLIGALGTFRGRVEAYPELKSDRNVRQLMEELTSAENRIAFARQAYNDSVMIYNTQRESFPANMVSGTLGFNEAALFNIDEYQRAAPVVKVD